MLTLKIHLPLNKLGFCLMCDSFFVELQNALFSLVTSSQHQWLQEEFLSRSTEHCRAATAIKETQQQQYSKRLKPQRCWPLLSRSQLTSRGCRCWTTSISSSSTLGKAKSQVGGVSKAIELSLDLCKQTLSSLLTEVGVKVLSPSCETKYWHRPAAVLWGQQIAIILAPALNVSDSTLHTPVQIETV